MVLNSHTHLDISASFLYSNLEVSGSCWPLSQPQSTKGGLMDLVVLLSCSSLPGYFKEAMLTFSKTPEGLLLSEKQRKTLSRFYFAPLHSYNSKFKIVLSFGRYIDFYWKGKLNSFLHGNWYTWSQSVTSWQSHLISDSSDGDLGGKYKRPCHWRRNIYRHHLFSYNQLVSTRTVNTSCLV